ncbi:MAG: hypothetical protein WCT08_02065 [Patescibacteria group bacterium]|jgi:hypothetical protein
MKQFILLVFVAFLAIFAGCAEKQVNPVSPEVYGKLEAGILGPDTVYVGEKFFLFATITGGQQPYQASWYLKDSVITHLPYFEGRLSDTGYFDFGLLVNSTDGQTATASHGVWVVPPESTLIVIDSSHVDTVYVTDTLNLGEKFCGHLKGCDKVINWLLMNPIGSYRLEFSAETQNDQPLQDLLVTIDGITYKWSLENKKFSIDLALPSNSTISVILTAPAIGHGIDVCLHITKL